VGKVERKKGRHSYFDKRKFAERRKHPFLTDVGLGEIAEHLEQQGHFAIPAENAPSDPSDDYALLAWAREQGYVFITRDWDRAQKMIREGLMHDRPGIIVLHFPKASAQELRHAIDLVLSARLRYEELWGRVVYISRGVFKMLASDGTEDLRVPP
jgi:predicted nuclease of predicted toxin-antitoxin system